MAVEKVSGEPSAIIMYPNNYLAIKLPAAVMPVT